MLSILEMKKKAVLLSGDVPSHVRGMVGSVKIINKYIFK
jgi:hypothetical protein